MEDTARFIIEGDVFLEDLCPEDAGDPDAIAKAAYAQIEQWVSTGYLPVITVVVAGKVYEVDLELVK